MSSPIGRPLLRLEDRPLLTGFGQFIDDIALPGALHLRFVRSPAAHAEIRAVHLDAARAALGVTGAYAAADLGLPPLHPPIENPLATSPPRPLLAQDVVRFVGEPVAAIVARSPYAAEDAANLVRLELAPLDVVAGTPEADAAAPLHAGSSNVLLDSTIDTGEVDAAFASAEIVFEREFRNPRYSAMPIEPRGAIAAPDGDGVRVWSSSQVPHILADVIAELLGLARERVRVEVPDIGGGFGQKAHAYPEEIIVAALAVRLGRPIKWIEDRSENLMASSHARDQRVHVRVAADTAGRLVAIDAEVTCDTGAYGVFPHGHILEALGTAAMIPGPYRLAHYRARSRSVATNKCPEGAYRGVGLPVSTFVHERVMDVLAGVVGVDRAEIRRRNLIGTDELPYTTVTHQRYDSGDYALALARALEAIGFAGFTRAQRRARREGRLLGLGIASYVEYSGLGSAVFNARGMVGIPGYDRAWIALGEDGRATVNTTLPTMGQGLATTFAQLAGAALGLEPESVLVQRPDTAAGAAGGTGTFASRSAITGGGAIGVAAAELVHRLFADASDRLEVAVDDLELRAGRVGVKGSPSHELTYGQIVAANPARFRAEGMFDPERTAYPYATHVCTVQVDPETGAVKLLRYVIAEDCGRVINPQIVAGQAHGAVAQGIGGALLESMHYDEDGQLLTASLMDYLVPTASDLIALELDHLEIPAPDSPNGAKGVGEGGTLAPAAAIANAVSDALGVEFNELPLTPERVRLAAAVRPEPRRRARIVRAKTR
ncbi:MAG: aerobic carbon-monoxide dehydrogenase large subunit [Solirubrobacteraceae bacterium]|nr:aerobic carbon-monoxide dehydrogenase large subunit [Solirubrobacteraceae bacterium]